jgi:hypothetical protein
MSAPELRTPAEWSVLDGVTVMDPDGWRGSRTLPAKSWDEPISREEWQDRLEVSTHSLLTVKLEQADLPRDWRAVQIQPGTPFWDEPSEMQPPGWFVFGGFSDDPEEGAAFVLQVEQALDRDDSGMSLERLAKAVAARLNGGAA